MRGNVNNGIDDLSRYTFGHFGERVKQPKFLQKYTDPRTETNLVSANVLVANSVKNLCLAVTTFYKGISRTDLKNLLFHILVMFTF